MKNTAIAAFGCSKKINPTKKGGVYHQSEADIRQPFLYSLLLSIVNQGADSLSSASSLQIQSPLASPSQL